MTLRIRWYGPSLILFATVVLVMFLGPTVAQRLIWSHHDARIRAVRQTLVEDANLADLSAAFSKVASIVEPSVVHVRIFAQRTDSGNGWLTRFDPLEQVGNGSGWVYHHAPSNGGDGRNYIITNNHVVEHAEGISVRFANGGEADAHVVGGDPLTDVAVLRVDEPYMLHPAAISPEPVEKGQIVFAFGSPFRFKFSVSQGIVSATGRKLDLSRSGKYEDFIQTDAAINPGNSGGPLTDIYGRVVGMNTAIASSRGDGPRNPGGFMGLGFAIPVSMAEDVARKIIENGQVLRGFLGVLIAELSPAMARSFGFEGRGVLVEHALVDGPAAQAGLQPGDIITHLAGQPVDSVAALRYAVAMHPPGSLLELSVFRQGRPLELKVQLGALPQRRLMQRGDARLPLNPEAGVHLRRLRAFGITSVTDFTRDAARQLGLRPIDATAIVDVRPGSIAAGQGVRQGDLIAAVNGRTTDSVDALRRLLRTMSDHEPLRLTLKRWSLDRQAYRTHFALLRQGDR